jgi:hypothetical protein
MITRTRYFVIGSLLVLAVGLGTGLVAYYVGMPGAASQSTPAELRYVARDASVVAFANVREIMTSDVWQRVRRQSSFPDYGQRPFEDQTGIDIESDIDYVIASLRPRPEGDTAGLVVARGRFSDVKIEAFMRERGASVEEHNGRRVIVRQNPSGESREAMALSFLEPGLVAVGSAAAVRSAIDQRQGRGNVTENSELMSVVETLEPGSAWAVGRLDRLQSGQALPDSIASKIPAITWFSVTGRIDSEVRGIIRADARDEQAANDLRDVVRGFLALANLQAGSRPGLERALQSLELGGTGNRVTLSFSIPGEFFDDLPPGQQ